MNWSSQKDHKPVGGKSPVLSVPVTLAGFAGVDPHTISLFGVSPAGGGGIAVFCAAALAAQLYWYVLRHQHLLGENVLEYFTIVGNARTKPGMSRKEILAALYPHGIGSEKLDKILTNNTQLIVRKKADLFSNRVVFALAVTSVYFLMSWI